MTLAKRKYQSFTGFAYHILRRSLESFGKNPDELDESEYEQVHAKACKTFELESLVLGTPEARAVIIPDSQLDNAVAEVEARYVSEQEFLQDLWRATLDKPGFRQALHRELIFDNVMQRVAMNSVVVNDVDVRLYYELHHDKFQEPEKRIASHILITVNPEFPENTREKAQGRIKEIEMKLGQRSNRFADFARRYSECPTAMEGGKLGEVTRGQLYGELDAALFAMQEDSISPVVETEMGYHLLYCKKIKTGRRLAFNKVAPRVREILQNRQQRNCQKAWLASLQQTLDR